MADSDDEPYTGPIPEEDPHAGEHALFWDTMPEDHENDLTFQAMEALKAETTPEESAEGHKATGNGKLRVALKSKSKDLMRDAIACYTDGIKAQCENNKLNSVLYSNRAHAESLLGNWRNCLQDAQQAKKLDPTNAKAHFRVAKATLHLKLWAECEAACLEGQDADPEATEFAAMLKDAKAKAAQEAKVKAEAAVREIAGTRPARMLADSILSRGWRVTIPQIRAESGSLPWLEADQSIHWPMVIIYPENMQQDVVQDVCETDPIDVHLDVMFGDGAPPLEWDTRREYTRERLELYYLSHAGKPLSREQLIQAMQGKWPANVATTDQEWGPKRYGSKAAAWKRLDTSCTLGELLARDDYVVPGMPLLFAVSTDTEYKDRFLEHGER